MQSVTLFVCGLSILATGCSHLEVDGAPAMLTAPSGGTFNYALPLTSLVLNGTAQLTSCPVLTKADDQFAVTLTGTVSTLVTADPDHQFRIPYAKMKSFLKETDFTVVLGSEKTLMSFNGTINDQAGPLLLASGLAVAKIAGAVVMPTPAMAASQEANLCTDKVVAALARVKKDQADIAARTAKPVGKPGATDPQLALDQADIDAATKEGGLVRDFHIIWTPAAALLPATDPATRLRRLDYSVDLEAIAKSWLTTANQGWFDDVNNATSPAVRAVKTAIMIRLAVDGWTVGDDLPAVPQDKLVGSRSKPAGLVVRDPALATVRLCKGACSDDTSGIVDTTDDLQPATRIAVNQLGRIQVMPLSAGWFDKSNLLVALNADGAITSVGTQSSNTAAANLATLGQIGDAVTTAKTNDATGATARAAYADTVNKDLADCIVQRDALLKAGIVPEKACQ